MMSVFKYVSVVFLSFFLTACGGGGGTQEVNTVLKPLKKTGQTKSYDADGNEVTDGSIKDDGYYQKGVTPSYTRDDTKAVVTDNITHLMWQDDAEASSVTKPWLTQENYDICTGSNGATKDESKCSDTSGDTATTYCENLTLGGFSDWRLPTRKELKSIVDYGRSRPAVDSVFVNITSGGYWSSTTISGGSNGAWDVYFDNGPDWYEYKSHSFYVRCVRAGE